MRWLPLPQKGNGIKCRRFTSPACVFSAATAVVSLLAAGIIIAATELTGAPSGSTKEAAYQNFLTYDRSIWTRQRHRGARVRSNGSLALGFEANSPFDKDTNAQ